MTTLSIRHTLTEICQTGIDLGRCAQVGLSTKGKIFFGSSETFCLLYPFIFGSPLKSTYYFASLGSAVLGLYGARQNQLWKSMVGGAIVGLTGTGFNILADSILGGSIVGLKSSAVRLAAGASGGALVAIATAHATKSSLEYKCLFSSFGMGMLGEVLLGAGVSGGLFVKSGDGMNLVNFAPSSISRIISITEVGFCAIATDQKLYLMISGVNQRDTSIFLELLNKKECLSLIRNPSDELYSYNELLTWAIECKAPADWVKMLLERPGIDLNLKHHMTGKALLEHITAELKYAPKEIIYWKYLGKMLLEHITAELKSAPKEIIYWEYLKHLLEYNSSNFMQDDNDKTPSFQVILEIIAKQNTDSQGDNNENTDNIPGSKEVLMQDIERIINNHGIQSHNTKSARKIGSEANHHPIPTDNDAPSTTPSPPDNNTSDSVTLGDSHHEVANHDLIDTPKWCSLL